MLVHNLLDVVVGHLVGEFGRLLVAQVVVAELGADAVAHVLALERQKRHVEVDQVAVDDRGMPQTLVVLFFKNVSRILCRFDLVRLKKLTIYLCCGRSSSEFRTERP